MCGRVLREEALRLRAAYAILVDRGELPRLGVGNPPLCVGIVRARSRDNLRTRKVEFHVDFFLRGIRLTSQQCEALQSKYKKNLSKGLRKCTVAKVYTPDP